MQPPAPLSRGTGVNGCQAGRSLCGRGPRAEPGEPRWGRGAGDDAAGPVPTAYAPLQPPQFLQQPPKPIQQQFVIQQQQLAPRGQPPPGPAAPQLQPLPPASPGPVPPPKAGASPGVPHGAGADGAAPNGHPGCHGAPRKFQHASAVILQLQPAGATVRAPPPSPPVPPAWLARAGGHGGGPGLCKGCMGGHAWCGQVHVGVHAAPPYTRVCPGTAPVRVHGGTRGSRAPPVRALHVCTTHARVPRRGLAPSRRARARARAHPPGPRRGAPVPGGR